MHIEPVSDLPGYDRDCLCPEQVVFYIVYRGKILVKGANITQVLSIINRL